MSDEPHAPPTGPKAGDDEERQKTDEERLLDEIVEQKDLVNALTGDTREEFVHRAPHKKKLGQLEFRYQLMVEKKRLARVLLKFQEVYGDLYSETCPFCLDDIHVHAVPNTTEQFFCCGGFICKSCAGDIRESGVGLGRCPLCREVINDNTVAENAADLMRLAKRGLSWAQKDYGTHMVHGREGFKKQAQTGLEWINKAAAQNYPPALYELSFFHRHGIASELELEKSEEKANELLLKAANLGFALANNQLAKCYFHGADGFEMDRDEFYFRASVVFALDNTHEEAAKMLGTLHHLERVPEPSPYLACYYTNIAACKDTDGAASYFYGDSVLHLDNHLHGDNIANGYNVWPAVFFWMRKSLDLGFNSCDMGCEDARELLKKWESFAQSLCGNCGRKVQTGEKFKQCSKCKAQWYCCKECQVKAWWAGHKKDCKRARILKFEDYLNAD